METLNECMNFESTLKSTLAAGQALLGRAMVVVVVSIQAVYSGVSSSNPAHTLIVLVKSDISNKKIIGERGHGWQMQAKEF